GEHQFNRERSFFLFVKRLLNHPRVGIPRRLCRRGIPTEFLQPGGTGGRLRRKYRGQEQMMATRMPRYDVRNDGVGPYAIFYCDKCSREYRSTPDVGGQIVQDIGKQAMGGLLRGIPLLGSAIADGVTGQD